MRGMRTKSVNTLAQTNYSKALTERAKENVKKANKPALGIFFFILYCFLTTLGYVVAQMLYNR